MSAMAVKLIYVLREDLAQISEQASGSPDVKLDACIKLGYRCKAF